MTYQNQYFRICPYDLSSYLLSSENNQVNKFVIVYSVLQGNLCDVSTIRSEPARQYGNNWAIHMHFHMHSLPQSQAEMYQVGEPNLSRGLRSPNAVGSMKGLTSYCKLTHCPPSS